LTKHGDGTILQGMSEFKVQEVQSVQGPEAGHMVISKDAEKKTMELLQLYVKKGEIAFPGEKSRKPRNYQTNLRSAHKQRVFQF
jgi:hypothetical protein